MGVRAPEPQVHPRLKHNNRNLVKSKAMRHGLEDKLPEEVSLARWGEAWKTADVCLFRGGAFHKRHAKEEERGNEKGK